MVHINHPLQSDQWAAFRTEWGNEVIKTSFGYITVHKLPLVAYKVGMFIKCPTPTQQMLTSLKRLANDKRLIFIKLEPATPTSADTQNKLIKLLRQNGAVPGKTFFTPTTFWIDLTKSETDLLASFSQKTRYNIKLAEKHGVQVTEDNSAQVFNSYWRLTQETSERQKFYAHNEKYHRLMWKHLHTDLVAHKKQPIARLLVARYKGEIITTWVLFNYGDFLYYPYGASSHKHKEVMANNLMMWEAIKLGKRMGCTTFDLWGREPGKGFTKFKEGYNPTVVSFLGSWDLVTSKLYYFYRAAEVARWFILKKLSPLIRR